MSLSPGNVFHFTPPPPPPPRSPGSAGSGSFPDRRVPAQTASMTAALGGVAFGHQEIGGSPYARSLSGHVATPVTAYAPTAFAQPSLSNSGANSPMVLRSPAGNAMVTEYNPQQWGRSGQPAAIQFRSLNTTTRTAASRALDESGAPLESPPPPYSPPPNQSISRALQITLNNAQSLPALQTSLSSPASYVAAEYVTPASAITVISPVTGRHRNDPPPTMSFPPPPGNARDRSTSRPRPDGRSIFSLSALTSRGKSTDRSSVAVTDFMEQGTNRTLAMAATGQWGGPSQSRQMNSVANRYSVHIPGPTDVPPAPPASRRSASTGALANSYGSTAAIVGSSFHLPGPPSGPPPGSSRAASMSRASDDGDGIIHVSPAEGGSSSVPILALPSRKPPHKGTQLGPVPPTPADWIEGSRAVLASQTQVPNPSVHSTSPHPLSVPTIDDRQSRRPEPVRIENLPGTPSRENIAKQIRERRSESRAARERTSDLSAVDPNRNSFILPVEPTIATPGDLKLASPNSGVMSRQGAVKKARYSPLEARSGPRSAGMGKEPMRIDPISTPPFSSESEQQSFSTRSAIVPLKALPTPPSQLPSNHQFQSPSTSVAMRSWDDETISQIPHTPSLPKGSKEPLLLNEQKPQPSLSSAGLRSGQCDAFARSANERHTLFLKLESQAASDAERITLFADYMVTESRIRRDQYSQAFDAMKASDVLDMTRNLWRPREPSLAMVHARSVLSATSSPPRPSRTDSLDSVASIDSPMSSVNTNFTPRTDSESPASAASSHGGHTNAQWARHQPVLSPIPSMAMSTVADPVDESRGRTPSRWWESSVGSDGNGGHRIERSKRELKYMGLHRDALASLQWQEGASPSHNDDSTPRTGSQVVGGYPPEKIGWREEGGSGPAVTPTSFRPSVPNTPDPHKLDVSRLVTLPPSYPRHFPAMNNKHPDLEPFRTALESLRSLDDIAKRKDLFRSKASQIRDRQTQEAKERHAQMRHNIQEQLQLGQMTYASAAAAEATFKTEESRKAQQCLQREFASFQPEVMTPMHALLSERITKASACIKQLKAILDPSAQDSSPNQAQEEGDERPELLEKLNLLKWLFEAREALHKEMFELEGEKNERYREVIMMPFRSGGQEDKMRNAQYFFDSDQRERKVAFEKSTHKRFEEFAKIVEENVSRGVGDQLNAFWDIAPPLLALVERVPYDLRNFDVQIPASEVEENPSYEEFPLQYLYSLLLHAKKSAYQFIESQVNLMCLLHEAQTGVMRAGIALLETQRCGEGEAWQDVSREMGECQRAEEQRLTEELKEKVESVESQWREALGSRLEEIKDRVEGFLVAMGGWDESLLD